MPLHHWVRLLTGLLALPAFALASDAAYDALDGRRWCLDDGAAAGSPELTAQLCGTVGVDGGALPRRSRDLVGDAVEEVTERFLDPVAGEARRLWGRLD